MGFELDQFVDPEHISQELMCPICCGVLERPVQTSSDHLFCEDELLEWMERSDMCPLSNTKLDPSQIKKPSRIILNILGGLMMKCSNRAEGCTWTGKYECIQDHLKSCSHKPRAQLCELLDKKTTELDETKRKYAELKTRYRLLEEENARLSATNETLMRQIKVYDAFVKHTQEEEGEEDVKATSAAAAPRKHRSSGGRAAASTQSASAKESDLQVINRLRLLEERIALNPKSNR